MLTTRLVAGGIASLLLASPLMAQTRGGTVELGIFGSWTTFDDRFNLDDAIGVGGRLGVFLTRNIAIEGDIGWSKIQPSTNVFRLGAAPTGPPGCPQASDCKADYMPIYLRLAFNAPIGTRSAFILGGHYVWHDYEFTEESGWGGLVGLRLGLSPSLALRFDGIYDWNNTDTPTPGEPDGGSDATISARAGLSLMLRTARPLPPPPPPPIVEPEPAPPPAPPPPPPPPPAPPAPDPAIATAEVRRIIEERIYFDFDRSDLRPEARETLDRKIPIFQANPNMRIRVIGHTDNRGSDEYNLALGQRRAAAAKAYLVQRGIAENRIDIVSMGEERPAVPNATTEAEHQQNRRDEFEIIAGGPNFMMPGM